MKHKELEKLTKSILKATIWREERRIKIILSLLDGPKTPSEISKAIKTSKQNLTYHLVVLLERKIIIYNKEGRNRFYSLSPNEWRDERFYFTCKGIYLPLEGVQ
jgi:DNA-binding transcriptional ArsR family regulator